MYHLYAVKIAATLAPCESKYMQHLVKSFKNHYEIDLYAEDFMDKHPDEDYEYLKEFDEMEMKKK